MEWIELVERMKVTRALLIMEQCKIGNSNLGQEKKGDMKQDKDYLKKGEYEFSLAVFFFFLYSRNRMKRLFENKASIWEWKDYSYAYWILNYWNFYWICKSVSNTEMKNFLFGDNKFFPSNLDFWGLKEFFMKKFLPSKQFFWTEKFEKTFFFFFKIFSWRNLSSSGKKSFGDSFSDFHPSFCFLEKFIKS